MRSGVCLITAALTIGVVGSAAAQGPPTLQLALEDALSKAAETSHRLAEARAREAGAQAGIAVRQSAERPTVTATASYTRTNHVLPFSVPSPSGIPLLVYPDVPNNYNTRLEMRWPIYTGGRTDALERAARAEADAVGAERQTAQADLRLEVTRAYWALVTARASLDVLEQGVARSQAHVNDANQRFMAGLVPPNEVSSAQAQEARARMLAIDARTQRDVTSAELARLIGVAPDQPLDPTGDLGRATTASPGQPLGPLVESARAARQERRALEQRVTAADAQRDAAAAGRLPTIQFLGGVDYARPNPKIFPRADVAQDSWDVGVGATWSLWDGGRTVAEVAQARAVSQAASERLAEFDSQLGVEVRQRALEVESAVASVAAATSGVTAAADARRVVDERYRAGVIAGIEVLDAEYALLQAQLDLTRAQATVRLAEAQLTRALGR
ncbi:MAG TPA: TolC family protein [Vicinamibacterales bacterium]|nr:TolC family protein [Vicinamibacterales bacterium]